MELTYSPNGELQDLDWTWVELAGIPPHKLPNLRLQAEVLRQKRISASRTERQKIGRNESCPCGSGRSTRSAAWGAGLRCGLRNLPSDQHQYPFNSPRHLRQVQHLLRR